MSAWSTVQAAWDKGWAALYARSSDRYQAAISADPTGALKRVRAFRTALAASRASLDQLHAGLQTTSMPSDFRASVARLEARYNDLAAGLYADAKPAQTALGVAPIAAGLVLAGVVFSVAGVAWAIGSYEYAVNLREQTALAKQELDARIQASQDGRRLQPSTLPAQPPKTPASSRATPVVLAGGLALAAGALFLARSWSRS